MLTLGPAEAEEQLRDCMAIGADRGDPSRDRDEEWDAQATAGAIVDAITREEPFDLIVFGNESADAGNYQVGIRVAYALGLPVVTGLKGLTVADGRARCEQEVAGRARRLRRAAAGGRHGEGGPEPAALPVGAGEAAREVASRWTRARSSGRASKLEKLRLVVPEGSGKQAEVLGERAGRLRRASSR